MKPLKESAPLQHWSCCQAFFRSANGCISVKVVGNYNNNSNTHTQTQSQQQREEQPRRCHWENFYWKSGFSFAPFCGILRFFRCRLLAWLLFTFCLTQNSTRFPFFPPPTPLHLPGHHCSPYKPLETKWCSWLRPSAKMFVTTQRRQVVPKELPSLLANPFQLQPLQLGQGSAADAKKTESWHRNAEEETLKNCERGPHEWLSKARTRKGG